MAAQPLKFVPPSTPPKQRKNRLAVDSALLHRGRAATVRNTREQVLMRLFDPAAPYPGVVPPGHKTPKTGMAMDQQVIQVSAWAQQWGVNSSLAEGQGFLGYAVLSELAQRAEYRAITETLAYEMVREGVVFKSTGDKKGERIKRLEEAFRRLDVLGVLAKAAAHDGFFGRGHVYLDTGVDFEEGVTLSPDEQAELKSPLGDGRDATSESKVSISRPLRRLVNVEPVWTYPTSYNSFNPLAPTWFKPSSWFVMGTQVHSSRLLTFVGREVPDLLKPAYSFGGLSMTQMAMPYVQNWLRTRQAVADLIWSFTVFVLKTNLSESLQVDGEQLFNRAEFFNQFRNNQGLMMLDKDLEDFSNVSASLGGLHELQAQAQEHMAAVSRIPLVKLLGIQPAGLNASSEGEIRTFYDWVHAYQEHLFRKNLDRILGFIELSEFGEVDPEITYEFKGLWQLDEAGESGVQKTKADIDDAYIAMGAISPEEVRERLANDDESQYSGLDLSEPLPQQPEIDPTTGEPAGGNIDPETGQPIDPNEMLAHNDPNETEQLSPGGLMHPRDPGNRMATAMTNKPASIGHPASLGFSQDESPPDHRVDKETAGFEHPAKGPHECAECRHFTPPGCNVVRGTVEAVDWCEFFEARGDSSVHALDEGEFKEELHPRGKGGKFAKHKGVSSSIHKVLGLHGFKANKSQPFAHYEKGEHKVSVLAHPEGNEVPSIAFQHKHLGSETMGSGSGNLLKHLTNLFGNPTSSSPPSQAPKAMTPAFVPSDPAYKSMMDDYGWKPLKATAKSQTYELPESGGTVLLKELSSGFKWTYAKPGAQPYDGKTASSLQYTLGSHQGLSPENKAKLGPLDPPSSVTSYYGKTAHDLMNGLQAKAYGHQSPKFKWHSDEVLTIGSVPGKNEGKWKIADGTGKELAAGYGVEELNTAFEALHPRGPGGKFAAKPGTHEFNDEMASYGWTFEANENNNSVFSNNSGYLHIENDGKWNFYSKTGSFSPADQGTDLGSLYVKVTGKPAPQPAPSPTPKSDVLKMADLKKVGAQKGSNPGGVYEAPDGKRYYVKNLPSENHVLNEQAAATLYKMAGSNTLTYVKSDDPKALVTEMASLVADNVNQLTVAQKKMAQADFAIHAWLANWDAVGLNGDNLGATAPGERPVNLDLGGSLAYRAQGGPKGSAFGNEANEWDTLRDPSKNPSAAALFKDMTNAELAASAERLRFVLEDPAKIRDALEAAGYPLNQANDLKNKLYARAEDILKRAKPKFVAPFDYKSENSGPSIYQLGKSSESLGTSAERSAVRTYTGGAYHSINEDLRFGYHGGSEEGHGGQIEKITSWLNQASMPAETICTRRVSSSYAKFLLKHGKPGFTFTDLGFISTSRTGAWGGELSCQIRIPAGAKAASVRPMSQHVDENEVLIQRGTRFNVIAFDPATKTMYLDMDQKHLVNL